LQTRGAPTRGSTYIQRGRGDNARKSVGGESGPSAAYFRETEGVNGESGPGGQRHRVAVGEVSRKSYGCGGGRS